MSTFPIKMNALLRLPFLIITATKKRAYVALDNEAIEFRLGWFKARIELTDIVGVEPMQWRWYYGYGLRIAPRDTLGLVGSSKGVVAVKLKRSRTFKVPFKIEFQRIAASLEDPEAFMEEIKTRLHL